MLLNQLLFRLPSKHKKKKHTVSSFRYNSKVLENGILCIAYNNVPMRYKTAWSFLTSSWLRSRIKGRLDFSENTFAGALVFPLERAAVLEILPTGFSEVSVKKRLRTVTGQYLISFIGHGEYVLKNEAINLRLYLLSPIRIMLSIGLDSMSISNKFYP